MRRRLLSARLERHLERGEEELRRSREAGDRHAKAFEKMMAAFDRFEARWDERDEEWKRHWEERNAEWERRWDEREARWDERDARFNKRLDENEQVMWEMNRRAEKAVQVLVKQSEAFNVEQTRRTDEIVAEIREARAEWREECRAHREALFALIDRLPPAAAA
jgi:hypothetical protein